MMDIEIDRQALILDAAFGAFAAYGYKRTTMEDIARASGLSRTALYQYFRSKEDIFRSLSEAYFATAMRDMEAALMAPGQTAEAALYAAFVAKDGAMMEAVFATPHGAELMDAGISAAPELVRRASATTAALLCRWLRLRGLSADLEPAESLAETIVAALVGLKTSVKSLAELRQGEAQLARLVARALR